MNYLHLYPMQLLKQVLDLIKRAPKLTKDARSYFVNKGLNRLKKDFALSEGSGMIK